MGSSHLRTIESTNVTPPPPVRELKSRRRARGKKRNVDNLPKDVCLEPERTEFVESGAAAQARAGNCLGAPEATS